VDAIGAEALAAAPGERDPVPALMRLVGDGDLPLARRNRAVWALGRLGDPRALPLLEGLHTGDACDHEHALCQKELGKAVALCRAAAEQAGG
jgi:HEAT repeat protein